MWGMQGMGGMGYDGGMGGGWQSQKGGKSWGKGGGFKGGSKGYSAAPKAPKPIGHTDAKSALMQYLQRSLKRSILKSDIEYTVVKHGAQHQAIVKLTCMSNQEFAGNLSSTGKEAEMSAAQQALMVFAPDVAATVQTSPPVTAAAKRPGETTSGGTAKKAKLAEEDNPCVTDKTRLNSIVMKIARRYLSKGETLYETSKVQGGYQSTVSLKALPGDWANRLWAGHVCATKQAAEQSAAGIAVKIIQEDPEMAKKISETKGKNKSGGGGAGGDDGWTWVPNVGKSKNGWAWISPEDLRERVTEAPVSGQVVEWKEKFGWIKPTAELDHPAAKMREGKIFISKKDLGDKCEKLAVGQRLKFHVYADPSGLGAEEITF